MITRRSLMIGAALSTVAASSARAQAWKAKYSELVFAVIPEENGSGVVDRWTPFINYLGKAIGTKVTLRIANDYAAVIEGQRAGNIQIAYYGPASFARARIIGVNNRDLRDFQVHLETSLSLAEAIPEECIADRKSVV